MLVLKIENGGYLDRIRLLENSLVGADITTLSANYRY
jgi:hypothetical protein